MGLEDELMGKRVMLYLQDEDSAPSVYSCQIMGIEMIGNDSYFRLKRTTPHTFFHPEQKELETEDIYVRTSRVTQIHPLKK